MTILSQTINALALPAWIIAGGVAGTKAVDAFTQALAALPWWAQIVVGSLPVVGVLLLIAALVLWYERHQTRMEIRRSEQDPDYSFHQHIRQMRRDKDGY